MDYKNDNRTPRDRITGEFLSELLFTDLGGDCDCQYDSRRRSNCTCDRERTQNRQSVRTVAVSTDTAPRDCRRTHTDTCPTRRRTEECTTGGNVKITGNYSLAMAYVQMQDFVNLYDIENGFCEGTIFKDLRFPFYPTPCRKEFN